MINVISVDYHSGQFREILTDSLARLADPEVPYKLFIHDNSTENVGHSIGLEKLIREQVEDDIVLVLDIDAHVILPNWNRILVDFFKEEWAKGTRLIAGQGGALKPVRPCVMMFSKAYFLSEKLTFQPQNVLGAHFDVGVLLNFQVLSKGGGVTLLPLANETYPGTWGNDYCMPDGCPLVYHHWYGTRWYNGRGEVAHESIDELQYAKFLESKESMISQYYAKRNRNC